MPTYTENLPASRSFPFRRLRFTPADPDAGSPSLGLVEITKWRTPGGKVYSTLYSVTAIPHDAKEFGDGVALRWTKAGTGETRDVFLSFAAPRRCSLCDCEGHDSGATEKADRRHAEVSESLGCCHLDGTQALHLNGWLGLASRSADADPATAADLDAAVEAAALARVGGYDVCPACGELGVFALGDGTGDRACVMCNEVFHSAPAACGC